MQTATETRTSLALQAASDTLLGKAVMAVAGSLFVALCAHIILPLPFTPVPLTLSDFAVLLVGLTLGPAVGFSALALYLLEGALGFPVFAPTGATGLAHLLGPTGGYLIAYPFAAALAGGLFRQAKRTFTPTLISCLCASALLMTTGTLWLGLWLHLAPAAAFRLGALPFLPGQLLKVVTAAGLVTSIRRLRTEHRP